MDSEIGQKGFGFLEDIPIASMSLIDRFIVPPFSVLDARQGYWQERKAQWLELGIESELGRGLQEDSGNYRSDYGVYSPNYPKAKSLPNATGTYASRKEADKRSNLTSAPQKPEWATGTGTENMAPGTSIFDPVLCECIYQWFCPVGGHILDPFAGGSVRGIVAAHLGYKYTGIDLSLEQLKANVFQTIRIVPDNKPRYIQGDARDIDALCTDTYDLIFTCPPYYNLEVYSDDPSDLSNALSYEDFLCSYKLIIAKALNLLKLQRFACFIVGNLRDKQGFYYNLVGDTVEAFKQCGVRLYNEAVLITSVGSLPIRITKQFEAGRKLGKTHQNVLVFYKGDPKRIKEQLA